MNPLLLNPFRDDFAPYRRTLVELGAKRPKLVVLGADLGNSCEIDEFQRRFPERYFNLGVAEQNAVNIAVGLAFEGFIPFFHSFGVFVTRRPYEQVCAQVALHRANVKLIGMIPGLTSRMGPTHQATDDLALMRLLPGMTVIDPADATEITQAIPAIADYDGPVYIRMMRREVKVLFNPDTFRFQIGKAVAVCPGSDLTLISCGLMLSATLSAAELLRQEHISAAVLHVSTLKPLDEEAILNAAAQTRAVVTVENHLASQGLGGAVAECLSEKLPTVLVRIGLKDQFAGPGTPEYLFKRYGLDPAGIAAQAKTVLQKKGG